MQLFLRFNRIYSPISTKNLIMGFWGYFFFALVLFGIWGATEFKDEDSGYGCIFVIVISLICGLLGSC